MAGTGDTEVNEFACYKSKSKESFPGRNVEGATDDVALQWLVLNQKANVHHMTNPIPSGLLSCSADCRANSSLSIDEILPSLLYAKSYVYSYKFQL